MIIEIHTHDLKKSKAKTKLLSDRHERHTNTQTHLALSKTKLNNTKYMNLTKTKIAG